METVVTVTLVEQGRQDSDDAGARRHGRRARVDWRDANAGWNESFDKMAAALADVQARR